MPPLSVLIALADPTRCRIIEILREGAQPVHVISGAFAISRPAISRHLRVLKQARLISEKKLGRENLYALHADKLKPVGEWLAEMQTPGSGAAAPKLKAKSRKSAAKPAAAKANPASKEAPAPTPVPAPEPVVQQVSPPARAPEPELASLRKPPKPKPEAPVSQMGFDF